MRVGGRGIFKGRKNLNIETSLGQQLSEKKKKEKYMGKDKKTRFSARAGCWGKREGRASAVRAGL